MGRIARTYWKYGVRNNMATRQKNLYLYLTIACFIGLITIFIVDGYMGIYDTINVTAGEREQTIEAYFWLGEGISYFPEYPYEVKDAYVVGVNRGDKVSFRYQVDNRLFSQYTADIEVSVERGQEKVLDLLSQPISMDAFGEQSLEWVVDTAALVPNDLLPEQAYEFSVIIKRGEIMRKIIVYIYPAGYRW